MNQVSDLVQKSAELSAPRQQQTQERKAGWVTALYVQFRPTCAHRFKDYEELLSHYRAILEDTVSSHHGDVAALSKDAALAVFSGFRHPRIHTKDAVEAAAKILESVGSVDKRRLSQNLPLLRVGIGLDAGKLTESTCNRHPCLEPGLQSYLNKARRLSDLNYQAPFPTLFVSHAIVDKLDHDRHYTVQNLGDVPADGHSAPLVVYALMSRGQS